jgi:hypothetical protein
MDLMSQFVPQGTFDLCPCRDWAMIGTNRWLKLSQPVTEWWRVFFAGLGCLRSSERTGNSGLSPLLRTRLKCASQNPRAKAGRKQPATLHFFHLDIHPN